jgi:flagellar basal-body rod protein FlgF
MDRFLYVGMTGANQLMLSQAVNANNLANTATTGFRADLQAFESANVDGPGFRLARQHRESGNSGVDLSYGPLRETGRALMSPSVGMAGWWCRHLTARRC